MITEKDIYMMPECDEIVLQSKLVICQTSASGDASIGDYEYIDLTGDEN